jgi:hypothetical protein
MADGTRRTVAQNWAANNPSGVDAPDSSTQLNGYAAVKPPYQEHNWLFQLATSMLQSAERKGFMEWLSTTTYAQYGLTFGSDGVIYQSQIASNSGNDPVSDDGTNWKPWLQTTSNPFMKYLHVREEQTAGTDGGTFATGTWVTRVLNTVKTNRITGASLASNQITLPAGDYKIVATAPTQESDQHRTILYDTTGTTDLVYSTSDNVSTGGGEGQRSHLKGEFTLSVESDLEIRHRCNSNGGGSAGLGQGEDIDSLPEVFTEVEIWKLD